MKMHKNHKNTPRYPKIKKPVWRHPFFCDWFCNVGPFRLSIYKRVDGKYDLLSEGSAIGTHTSLVKAKKAGCDFIQEACNEILSVLQGGDSCQVNRQAK